jgi:hypothetical protein
MRAKTENEPGGIMSRISANMTSVAAIATAIATITTSVSAMLGLYVHHQATQLHQAHQRVAEQAVQIRQLQHADAAAAVATSPAPSPTATQPAASLGSIAHYLSNLTPTVDNQYVENGQQVIAAQPYPNSIAFGCNGNGGNGDQPGEAYDIAGSSSFTAEVGIADDTQNVTNVIATVTFSNEAGRQLGKPVQVSLGHPVRVTVNVNGVTQLGMTCSGRDARTSQTFYDFNVAMGDAGVS